MAILKATSESLDLTDDYTFTGKISGAINPSFSVKLSEGQTVSTATWTKMNFNSEISDSNGAFNTTNKQFVVPSGEAGKYLIYGQVYRDYGANGTHIRASISKNNSRVISSIFTDGQGIAHTATVSAVMDLAVGDTIHIDTYHTKGSNENYSAANQQFYGFKIGN